MDYITTIIDLVLKSPLLVALLSVFGVKLIEYYQARSKVNSDDNKDVRSELWKRVEFLETQEQRQNARNDILVMENAKLGARVNLLESQNALQTSEMARITHERDGLRKDLDTTGEFLHKTKLELTAANVRISQLERHIENLELRPRASEEE